jgi:hypothetical protein
MTGLRIVRAPGEGPLEGAYAVLAEMGLLPPEGADGQALTEALVDAAGFLHESLDEDKRKLDAVRAALAPRVAYPEGRKTAHVGGRAWEATVQRKDNVHWNQEALDALRQDIGEEAFRKVFRFKWEPQSQKALDVALSEHCPFAAALRAAFTVREGTPSVSFKRLEVC